MPKTNSTRRSTKRAAKATRRIIDDAELNKNDYDDSPSCYHPH